MDEPHFKAGIFCLENRLSIAGSAILAVFKGVSKSVQVLFHGIEAVLELTLTILKQRALYRFAVLASVSVEEDCLRAGLGGCTMTGLPRKPQIPRAKPYYGSDKEPATKFSFWTY